MNISIIFIMAFMALAGIILGTIYVLDLVKAITTKIQGLEKELKTIRKEGGNGAV